MANLVDELKEEHCAIVATLEQVKTAGIASKEGQAILQSAKVSLLAHLKKEDTKLYPVLNGAALNDHNLKRTLEMFAKDMEETTEVALSFFEQYLTGGSGVEFAIDYGRLCAKLSQRISKEEKILYEEYAKLGKRAPGLNGLRA
jgi:hypothetical protein